MELYYKDLISEEGSLEKLVDDLMLVVQGAEDYASAAGAHVELEKKAEITARLALIKDGCRRAKEQTMATALAVNKVLRQYPYSSAGFAFAIGLVAGAMLKHSRK